MRIGIKYCGGCNPRYDRGEMVGELKNRYPEHTYYHVSENRECDIWLLVNGCERACASTEGLMANRGFIFLSDEEDFHNNERIVQLKEKA